MPQPSQRPHLLGDRGRCPSDRLQPILAQAVPSPTPQIVPHQAPIAGELELLFGLRMGSLTVQVVTRSR